MRYCERVRAFLREREKERAFAVKGLELNFTSLMQNTAIWEQIYILSTENQNNNDELLFSLRMGCFDASLKEESKSFCAWRWGDEYPMSQQVPCTWFELLKKENLCFKVTAPLIFLCDMPLCWLSAIVVYFLGLSNQRLIVFLISTPLMSKWNEQLSSRILSPFV